MTRRGFYDAKPRDAWGDLEAPLWGTPTGDGFFVVDVDACDGLDALRREIGCDLPETLTAKTPRGFHAYFRQPAGVTIRNRQGVVPGVDVRGVGGYVIAWPWINAGTPIAEAPGALVELCRPRG